MTPTLSDLLERVKSASGPDRELDAEIFAWSEGGRIHYFDAEAKNYVWERPIDGFWIRSVKSVPTTTKFTGSVDAALALVERLLPGWGVQFGTLKDGRARARVALDWPEFAPLNECHDASSKPLAILAALLTALQASPAAMENTDDDK